MSASVDAMFPAARERILRIVKRRDLPAAYWILAAIVTLVVLYGLLREIAVALVYWAFHGG